MQTCLVHIGTVWVIRGSNGYLGCLVCLRVIDVGTDLVDLLEAEVPSILIPEIHPQFPPVAAHARGDILNASIIFSASATLDSPYRRTTLSSLGLDLIHVNGRLKADQIFLLLLHTFSQ